MKQTTLFVTILCFAAGSCTKDKTDYASEIGTEVPQHLEFKEAYALNSNGYNISLEAINGTFYTGYNEIHLTVTDGLTGENVKPAGITFRPTLVEATGQKTSCPHLYALAYQEDAGYFSGYSVFTAESGAAGTWDLRIGFTVGGQTYAVDQRITVEQHPNKNRNMTTFTGKDDRQYLIALVSPQTPSVGENELIAGIYRLDVDDQQGGYTQVDGYTLLLDPRMPEPSMGNHSSPNNVDLTQQEDGLYRGLVNYTMTGNWTLNLIMLNSDGRILRGTEVPTDFTPGVAGVKSELRIDILF